MTRTLLALTLAACLLGCSTVKDAAINTAEVAAAGNDRYTELATQVLDGSVDQKNGPAVTKEDLEKTPASVRTFLNRLLTALHVNRFAWHSVLFQLDKGPDPETLGFKPVKLPEPEDENDELLEDD
jgi:hypothetical protein